MSFNAFNVRSFDPKLATDGNMAGVVSWLEELVAENMKFHQERAVYHNKAYEYWFDVSRALKSVPADQLPALQKAVAFSAPARHEDPEPEAEVNRSQSFVQNPPPNTYNSRTSGSTANFSAHSQPPQKTMQPPAQPPSSPPEAAPRMCIASYTYKEGRLEANSLNFQKNQVFQIIDDSSGWWLVTNLDSNEQGYVPMNYMRVKFSEQDEARIAPYLAKLMKGSAKTPSPPAANVAPTPAPRKVNIVASPAPRPKPTPAFQTPTTTNTSTYSNPSSSYSKPTPAASVTPAANPVSRTPAAQPGVTRARARFDYSGSDNSFLSFKAGEILTIQGETTGEDWWLAVNEAGVAGYAPSNFLSVL